MWWCSCFAQGFYSSTSTVLSRFLAHAPLSEHTPLLEYKRTCIFNSFSKCGISTIGTYAKKRNYTVFMFSALILSVVLCYLVWCVVFRKPVISCSLALSASICTLTVHPYCSYPFHLLLTQPSLFSISTSCPFSCVLPPLPLSSHSYHTLLPFHHGFLLNFPLFSYHAI